MQKLPFVVLLPILSSLSPSPQTVPEHPYYQLPTSYRKTKQQQVQYVQRWLAVFGCPYLALLKNLENTKYTKILINKIRQVQFLQKRPAVPDYSGLLFENDMPRNIKIISEKYNKKEPSNKSNLCKDGWWSVVVLDGCSQEGQRAPLQFSTIQKYKDKYKHNTHTKHSTGEIQRYKNTSKSKGQARQLQPHFFSK